jgi:hypothetical protein
MPATSSAPPSLVTLTGTNTTLCIVSGSDSMPLSDIQQMLARHFSPSALRRRVLDERDNLIRELVAHYDFGAVGRSPRRSTLICAAMRRAVIGTYPCRSTCPTRIPNGNCCIGASI